MGRGTHGLWHGISQGSSANIQHLARPLIKPLHEFLFMQFRLHASQLDPSHESRTLTPPPTFLLYIFSSSVYFHSITTWLAPFFPLLIPSSPILLISPPQIIHLRCSYFRFFFLLRNQRPMQQSWTRPIALSALAPFLPFRTFLSISAPSDIESKVMQDKKEEVAIRAVKI